MTRIDPTLVLEHMARRLRTGGAAHPVAGAVALAARGHTRLDHIEFAADVGRSLELVSSNEGGGVAFGDLPSDIGMAVVAAGADLLALADLEKEWQNHPPDQAADS